VGASVREGKGNNDPAPALFSLFINLQTLTSFAKARRQFAYMWRGQPAEATRLNKARAGAVAQPKMPQNDPVST
jgi:hypothetical protein